MSLQPGTTLGHYEVTAKIGAGEIGEVWRAHDTQLCRDVAIKVLANTSACLCHSQGHRLYGGDP